MGILSDLKSRQIKTGGTGKTLKQRVVERMRKQIQILEADDFNNHGVTNEKGQKMKSWYDEDATSLSCKIGKSNMFPDDNALGCKDKAEAIETLNTLIKGLQENETEMLDRIKEEEAKGNKGDDDDDDIEEKKD